MKITHYIIYTAAFVGMSVAAEALTVAVAQDTYSTTGKIAPANGKAVVLPVNSKQKGFIRFDLNDLAVVPESIQAGNVQSASLRLYLTSAKFPAAVSVHRILADWQETFTGSPLAEPAIGPVLATIPAQDLVGKRFVSVDVTAAVVNSLQTGIPFGFALQTQDAKAKLTFASKEGPATGYGAELEIVANPAANGDGALVGSSAFIVEQRPNNAPATPGSNIFIGLATGAQNTIGSKNTFVGTYAGQQSTIGDNNSYYGYSAGFLNTTGSSNSFFGMRAGETNTTGTDNTFLGARAGAGNGNGSFNTYIGSGAGLLSMADNNVFIGAFAGEDNFTGTNNVFVGRGAGANNVSGIQNCFLGINAGTNSTASFNSFFGAGAGQNTQSGIDNSAFGNVAGINNTTGQKNTFIGANSGGNNTVENKNTYIGEGTVGAVGITNSTAIGQGTVVSTSNAVVLGNNCNVGIRTSAPNSTLQVNGSLSLPVRFSSNTALTSLGDNDYVLINTGTFATTILLPQPTAAGRVYVVKNRASANATLAFLSGGSNIDGANSLVLAQNAVVQLITDGTNWFKIN